MAVINGTAANDVLIGTASDDFIYGFDGNDTLYGMAGNDLLDGGAGADTMSGGLDNDTYVVDNIGDVVIENAGEGTDTVQSSIDYTLGANVENLTLMGTAAINGTGNSLDNVITGNSAVNTLTGGQGNDTYIVQNTDDVVIENAGEGTDTVYSNVTYTLGANIENLQIANGGNNYADATGNALNNTLSINTGGYRTNHHTFDGGLGADTMIGGISADTYIVDNIGDVVVENLDAGTDTIQSSVTYTLSANVENLTLTGAAAINGTGNGLDNIITGNSAANIIDGGVGADTLTGGLGNDTYVVDNIGDVVIENAGEGTDTVQSSINYTLGANVENLTLTGTAAINGTGNALNNALTGNSSNNVLDGGAGADTMKGGLGNDTYIVDNSGDTVTEATSAGTDTVMSAITYTLGAHVENLTLTANGAINGTGNSLNNVLTGNAANNVLTGGAGSDIFVFNATLGATNVDTITDFTSGSDSIQLALAMFSGIGATGALSASAFVSGAGVTAATTSTQHIAYDTTSGMLYYDADGVGGAASVAFATLTNAPTVTAANFAVV